MTRMTIAQSIDRVRKEVAFCKTFQPPFGVYFQPEREPGESEVQYWDRVQYDLLDFMNDIMDKDTTGYVKHKVEEFDKNIKNGLI